MHHVDEALGVAVAPGEVALDQLLDDIGDLRARERRADDLAERRTDTGLTSPPVAADLIWHHLAAFVDAEYADVTDVWWPQAFMQPEILMSISLMSCR